MKERGPTEGTTSSAATTKPNTTANAFAQVNAALLDRGLLDKPLDVSGMADASIRSLSDVLHGLIAQRTQDSDLREQLASRNRVLESSLERTKRFWKEDEEKRADAERKQEALKAQLAIVTEQLGEANTALRRTRDELQKTRKDSLTVKQQAAQQRQANDRQMERMRARYTEEATKSLRTQVTSVFVAGQSVPVARGSTTTSDALHPSDTLARRQIEDLERRRREAMDYNAALKRIATECLNLARQAGTELSDLVQESKGDGEEGRQTASLHVADVLFQRDLFPPINVLQADYSVVAARGVPQHPAVVALSRTSEQIEQQVRSLRHGKSMRAWSRIQEARKRMRESISDTGDRAAARTDETSGRAGDDDEHHHASESALRQSALEAQGDAQQQLDEMQHMLDRALQRVEQLESQVRAHQDEMDALDAAGEQSGNHEAERRALQQQAADVERQRQRYLSLCRALEEQEAGLAAERQRMLSEREQLTLEHSLSMSASVTGGETTQDSSATTAIAGQMDDAAVDDSREATFSSSFVRPVTYANPHASTPQQPQAAHRPMKRPLEREQPSSTTREENKENKAEASSLGAAKRVRVEQAPKKENGTQVIAGSEMRFVTMRKQRNSGR